MVTRAFCRGETNSHVSTRPLLRVSFALGLCIASVSIARAAGDDDFLNGKQIKLIISGNPGDAYDVYARILARFIPRHLAGNPIVILQNMPGAAGIVSASYMYNVAPRDGTVIGVATTGVPTDGLLSQNPPQFDVLKFGWIGSVTKDPFVGFVWRTSPVQTLQEMKSKEVIMGGLATAGSASTEYPTMAQSLFGFKIKLISGYASTPAIKLATERGEINGSFANSWSSFKLSAAEWLAKGDVRIVVQFGFQKHPDLPDAPLFVDEATTDRQRQILKVMLGRQEYAKGFYLPPGVAEARLAIWRRAFDETMRDDEFLAAMREAKLDVIGTMTGDELTRLVAEINRTPPDVVAQIKEIIAPMRSK